MSDFELIANSLEKKYLSDLLKSDRRLNGRQKDEFREVKIETGVIGTALGSSLVQLGKTKVICGVKAQLGTPYPDSPNKGSLMIGYEESPLAAPQFRAGPPQPSAIELGRVTDRLIRESECIDMDKLCIIPGEKIWTIIIDIYPLDSNGNLFDAAAIAAYAALATAKMPETKIDDDGNVEVLETMVPIPLKSFPVSVTTYKIGDHYITDADLKEEVIADARISFGTTDKHIVSGQKGGRGGMKSKDILEILKKSIQTASELREIIRAQLPN